MGSLGGRSECVKWLQEESEEARATQTSGGSGRSHKSQNRSARNQSGASSPFIIESVFDR